MTSRKPPLQPRVIRHSRVSACDPHGARNASVHIHGVPTFEECRVRKVRYRVRDRGKLNFFLLLEQIQAVSIRNDRDVRSTVLRGVRTLSEAHAGLWYAIPPDIIIRRGGNALQQTASLFDHLLARARSTAACHLLGTEKPNRMNYTALFLLRGLQLWVWKPVCIQHAPCHFLIDMRTDLLVERID
jgi:hypothetical protein